MLPKPSSRKPESVPLRDNIHNIADNLVFSGTLLVLFLRPFLSGRTYPTYNHFFNIAIILLAALWLIKAGCKGKLELHNRLLTAFVLGFFLVCLFTFFTTTNKGMTLRSIYEILSYALLFLILANNFREYSSIKAAIIVIVSAGLLVNLNGIFQKYHSLAMTREYVENAIKTGNQDSLLGVPIGYGILNRLESTRIFSTFLFPNAYALYLCILGAITLGWLWSAHGEIIDFARNSFRRATGRKTADSSQTGGKLPSPISIVSGIGGILLVLLLVISCLLVPWCLWLTYSRGGLLSAGGVFLVFLVVKIGGRKLPKEVMVAAVVLVIICAILHSTTAFSADKIKVKDVSFLSRLKDSETIKQRFSYWKAALGMVSDNPWFGVGWGAFESAYPRYMILGGYPVKLAHNNYLQVCAETGIVGLNMFVGIWLVAIYTFWRKVRSPETGLMRGLACGFGAGIIAFIINSFVDFALYLPTLATFAFATLGLLAAAPSGDDEQDIFSLPFKLPAAFVFILVLAGFVLSLCNSFVSLSLYSEAEEARATVFPSNFALQRGFKYDPARQYAVLRNSVPELQKSIHYFSYASEPYFMLGDTYLKLVEIEKNPALINDAIQNLKRAAELNPLSPYIQQSLAIAYWMQGSATGEPEYYQKALAAEEEAARNFPVHPAYHQKLAEIQTVLGNTKKAGEETAIAAELAKHYREF